MAVILSSHMVGTMLVLIAATVACRKGEMDCALVILPLKMPHGQYIV